MHLNYALNGHVTDRFLEFYRGPLARGGAGLIVIEGADINDESSDVDFMHSIKRDKEKRSSSCLLIEAFG